MLDFDVLYPDPATRPARIRGFMRLARRLDLALRKSGRLELAARFALSGDAESHRKTGIATIDAARAARFWGCDPEVVDSIRHLSGAFLKVRVDRPDLADEVGPDCRMRRSTLSRALTYCDLRTGPDGAPVPIEARVATILPDTIPEADRRAMEETFRQIDAEFSRILDQSEGERGKP